jgi:pyrimidine operon attenuation protein/uracil phosphoribosyltransferase
MRNLYDENDVARLIQKLAHDIAQDHPGQGLVLVGIRTRGETLAGRLEPVLRGLGTAPVERGVLDITLYRDDLSEVGPRPLVRPTRIDVSLDQKSVVLVDDVVFTGRSVRAALDALSDFGRPSTIRLAVLVDRGGRELPIQPDYCALRVAPVPPDHRVHVRLREVDGIEQITIEPRGDR